MAKAKSISINRNKSSNCEREGVRTTENENIVQLTDLHRLRVCHRHKFLINSGEEQVLLRLVNALTNSIDILNQVSEAFTGQHDALLHRGQSDLLVRV